MSRCHHFDTVEAPAPMSDAIASRDGQSSIMDRNVVSSVMSISLGHTVLKSKANVSHALDHGRWNNPDMAERLTETEEKAAFILRVKKAREARFDTQNPMCTILGIAQGTYKQYETRTPLPHRYIPKFIAATGVSYVWLLTGEGDGPPVPEFPKQVPKRMGKRPRRKAA